MMATQMRKPEAQHEAKELRRLVALHRGNLSQVARDIPSVTRQAVMLRLAKHHLLEFAAKERLRHGVVGRRDLPVGASAEEKKRILAAVAKAPNYQGAAKRLGINERTLYRKLAAHGITKRSVERSREKRTTGGKSLQAGR